MKKPGKVEKKGMALAGGKRCYFFLAKEGSSDFERKGKRKKNRFVSPRVIRKGDPPWEKGEG